MLEYRGRQYGSMGRSGASMTMKNLAAGGDGKKEWWKIEIKTRYNKLPCRRSSVVEQLIRNQQVRGSNPRVGLTFSDVPHFNSYYTKSRRGKMDLAQINEMKAKILEELRQMESLKLSMERTLAGLYEWEKHLQNSTPGPVKIAKRKPQAIQEIQPIPHMPVKSSEPSAADRIDKALSVIRGEFTRSQLLAEAEGDGKGAMGSGSFSSAFSRLLKKQRIICVKGTPSHRDSLYMKSSEAKSSRVQEGIDDSKTASDV
jgi:hypothetical protein